jgi:hypothetical protein
LYWAYRHFFIGFILAIFEQTPGKVKQDKDFSQESKHKERSIASSRGSTSAVASWGHFVI